MHSDIRRVSPSGENVLRFFNPVHIVLRLWQFRDLIRQLTWREVSSHYRGSFLGMAWSFIHPLFMLCIYTFVFSIVFQTKWGTDLSDGRASFALVLFLGLITFNVFSETVGSAPSLILGHVNYVKKVVFPLEIFPLVRVLSVTINASFSLVIFFVGVLLVYRSVSWTAILLPLVWFPLISFSLGCAYFVSALGVFVRDVGTVVGTLVMMLFFLSPIFYPLSAIPLPFRSFCRFNPIAVFVEDARKVVLGGQLPDWPWFLGSLALSFLVFILGFVWFMKSKRAFADVI